MTRQVGIIWTNNGFILICKVLRPFRQDILRACSEYGIFFFCSYVFFCEIELIYVKFLRDSCEIPAFQIVPWGFYSYIYECQCPAKISCIRMKPKATPCRWCRTQVLCDEDFFPWFMTKLHAFNRWIDLYGEIFNLEPQQTRVALTFRVAGAALQ